MSEYTKGYSLKSLLFLFLFSGISLFLPAQQTVSFSEIQNFLSNHIPIDNQNWEMYQSPVSGYVYFANSNGLVEYNGISARTFSMPFRQGVRSVYVNNSGVIFTGSFEDFGFWQNNNKGVLNYKSLAQNADVRKNDEIWNIFELNNTLFFQSFTTIYRFDSTGVLRIPGPSNMLFMFRVGDSFIVQGLGSGLFRFDGVGYKFIEGSERFGSKNVLAIIDRRPDEIWICTAKNGIFIYDGQTFSEQKSEISDFLKEQTCNAGLEINDSLIVFGTIQKGIVFCDEKGNIQKSYNYSSGLNNNTVLSLFKDRKDGLWVGLDEGANFINVSAPETLYANFTGNLGTIYTAIRKQDLLYLGTNHGLFVADIRVNRGVYSFTNLKIIPNTQGQVWTLAQFDDQILCGHNDGTLLLDGNSFRQISDVTGGWSIQQYNDLLLEGTYTGIISFMKDRAGKWSYRNRIKGYIEPSRSIEVDYLGYLWAAHPQKGIYRLELNEAIDSVVNALYFSTISDTSNRLTISKINNQVVFMTSENIYAFDYENKSFSPIKSLAQGLGEYIKATQIITYQKNSYWFILGNKIALFDISRELEAKKMLEFFHKFAELPGREQQIIPLDEETLLIPTRKAFTTFDITRLNKEEDAPSIRIDHLLFSGKTTSTTVIPAASSEIVIPNRENNITVYVADPAGFESEDQEYWYRIVEFGDRWHSTTYDNFSFLNLKFGHYHIQVKASASEKITGFDFIIRRPGFLSTTAILIYLVILALLIFTGIKIFQLELKRQRKLIEYEVGKNKLENELDSTSYELMLTMRYLIEKNEIMTELNHQITQLKEQSSKFPQKFVREMERIINSGLNSQTEEWKNAMNNLKLSQQGFFKKMLDKYPHLTPNDLRLCSYLRMNFTTKEIANLLNISGRAVEISRYRLRRKLNIGHDINLTEFLIREIEMGDE
jgi:ligand-binding sensor domain-containing protein/DNA-binding CsgD family transcriptional regulator